MIYLDNAATTFPKPRCVYDEVLRCMKNYCGNPGRSSHKLSIESSEKIFEARNVIAELFNAQAENVVFTYNTTYALNIAIKSNLEPDSHVLISDIEHNSVIRPVFSEYTRGICSYDFFSTEGNDEDIINDILSKITPKTSMLICTQASNVCSKILPIKKIGALCHNLNIYFIVDGAQSAGIYDIDLEKMQIDALCIPSHKALYGPQGTGVVIFKNEKIGKSFIEGGTGINSFDMSMPDFLPEGYEAGTLSTPTIVGLCEGVKWVKSTGLSVIRHHEENLYKRLCDLLSTNEKIICYKMSENYGNTLLFNVIGLSSANVSYELDKRGICTRSGFHCAPLAHKKLNTGDSGAVRVSIGAFNTQKDIYALFDALQEIIIDKKI